MEYKFINLRKSVRVVLCFILLPTHANAQIPPKFQGVWILSPSEGKNTATCTRKDWEKKQNDSLIYVKGKTVLYWEAGCDVKALDLSKSQSDSEKLAELQITFSCEGEGLTWKSRELWSVQYIENRLTLVAVTLKQYDWRDNLNHPVENSGDLPSVTIYKKCE